MKDESNVENKTEFLILQESIPWVHKSKNGIVYFVNK
jgi:hypothetical protein